MTNEERYFVQIEKCRSRKEPFMVTFRAQVKTCYPTTGCSKCIFSLNPKSCHIQRKEWLNDECEEVKNVPNVEVMELIKRHGLTINKISKITHMSNAMLRKLLKQEMEKGIKNQIIESIEKEYGVYEN